MIFPHLVKWTLELMAGALVSILEPGGQELLPWNIRVMSWKEPGSSKTFLNEATLLALDLLFDVCYIIERNVYLY